VVCSRRSCFTRHDERSALSHCRLGTSSDVWTSPLCDFDVLDNAVVATDSGLISDRWPVESDMPECA